MSETPTLGPTEEMGENLLPAGASSAAEAIEHEGLPTLFPPVEVEGRVAGSCLNSPTGSVRILRVGFFARTLEACEELKPERSETSTAVASTRGRSSIEQLQDG